MKKFWSVIILCFPSLLLQAGQATDSLQQLLNTSLADSLRLRVLNEISYQIADTDLSLSLLYAEEGLKLAESLNKREQKRQILQQMGLSHYRLGNYDKTLGYFRQALHMYEEDGDLKGISKMYNNLGILYQDFDQPDLSLAYYKKALKLKRQFGDSSLLTSTYCNIGLIYLKLNQTEKARPYFMQALAIDRELDNKNALVYTYENLGRMYAQQNLYDSALYVYNTSLSLLEKDKGDYERATTLNSIARIYLQTNRPLKALPFLEEAIVYGRKINTRIRLKESYKGLSEAYSMLKDYQKAYQFHQQYIALKDSIFSEENLRKIRDIESNYQIQRREKEIELLKKDALISNLNLSRNHLINNFLYSGLFLFSILIIFLYKQYKAKNTSNNLLKIQNNEISARNDHITSSINYARTIQEAILPQENRLLLYFPDSFVFCRPRDIVNGDFYWFYPQPDYYLLAVVDCTGHGVPGAFMTVMANSLLNQIVIDHQTHSPASILDELHHKLQHMLHSEQGFRISEDGLDLVVCRLDKNTRILTYASAKRPVYHVQDGELRIFKGNKATLGGPLSVIKQHFAEYSFSYSPGSCLYLFTDGLTDQFGEHLNKKFMHNRLRNLLVGLQNLPMQQQKRKLDEALKLWQGKLEQTDDMLMLGLRL